MAQTENFALPVRDRVCPRIRAAIGAEVGCARALSTTTTVAIANAELLETMLDCARSMAGQPGSVDVDRIYGDWLEEVITNFADELDLIEGEVPRGIQRPIIWVDNNFRSVEFRPSVALQRLLELAQQGGLAPEHAQLARAFCDKYGCTIEALLHVYQVG